jgi:hypothetical protein
LFQIYHIAHGDEIKAKFQFRHHLSLFRQPLERSRLSPLKLLESSNEELPFGKGEQCLFELAQGLQQSRAEVRELGVADGGEEMVEAVVSISREIEEKMVVDPVAPLSDRVQLAEPTEHEREKLLDPKNYFEA